MEINFVLICDGSADVGLGNHVQAILLQNGATQVNWTASYQGRRLQDKIRFGLRQTNHPEMLFVHRDAEVADPEERYAEICSAIGGVEFHGVSVGIVPRRMTEAWLLLDEPAIREVVGRPRGVEPLHLPSFRDVESLPDPKERLREALLVALAPKAGADGKSSTPIGRFTEIVSWKTSLRAGCSSECLPGSGFATILLRRCGE